METYSVVIFSNNDLDSLKRISEQISAAPCPQVIWAVEGDSEVRDFLNALDPGTNRILFSSTRLGKAAAYNRSHEYISGSIVFLVSADIEFDPEIFKDVLDLMSKTDADLVIPRIEVKQVLSFAERIGSVLWELRDKELEYLNSRGKLIHGGEFIAVRRKFLSRIPDVVNEDSLQCIIAQANGAKAIYTRELTAFNSVPISLAGLVNQRRRIDYGYIQLRRMGFSINVLSFMVSRDLRILFKILGLYIKCNPSKAILLPFLFFIETVGAALGRSDYRHGRSHKLWDVIETHKTKS